MTCSIKDVIRRTIPAKKIKFIIKVCLIFIFQINYNTYESCMNKIIFLFNNTFLQFINFIYYFYC